MYCIKMPFKTSLIYSISVGEAFAIPLLGKDGKLWDIIMAKESTRFFG